mmetsp:Transcript_35668/g.49517  ORF Transcript_35668/g.49517 Transcript_35668/m.49517 type:complete len:113 (+) Transcript_35668:163-501(+)
MKTPRLRAQIFPAWELPPARMQRGPQIFSPTSLIMTFKTPQRKRDLVLIQVKSSYIEQTQAKACDIEFVHVKICITCNHSHRFPTALHYLNLRYLLLVITRILKWDLRTRWA